MKDDLIFNALLAVILRYAQQHNQPLYSTLTASTIYVSQSAGPADMLSDNIEALLHNKGIPLFLRALLRNIATLPPDQRPTVEAVVDLLCTSNMFPDPTCASRVAWEIWSGEQGKLNGKPGEQGPRYLDLNFEEGATHFSLNGERLFFLTDEEMTELSLEVRGRRLYRIGEKESGPAEGARDCGDVSMIDDSPE